MLHFATSLRFRDALTNMTCALLALGWLLSPTAVSAGWDEGVAAFKAGDYRHASDLFADYVGQNPKAPQVHYMLGLSLLQQKRLMESLGPLDQAVQLAPTEASYRMALAQAQLKARRAAEAVDTLAAQDLDGLPTGQWAAYDTLLASAATSSKDAVAALGTVRRVLQRHVGAGSLWLALAQLEKERGDNGEALEAYGRAFDLDDDASVGLQGVHTGFRLARDHNGEERRSWYARSAELADELAKRHPSAKHYLLAGEAHMGAGDLKTAEARFEKTLWEQHKEDAETALPHYYLARCALADERADDTLKHLEAAEKLSPAADLQAQVLLTRGSAYRQLENFQKAAEVYARAGRADKVAEMETLIAAQNRNAAWDAAHHQCRQKRADIRQLMTESEDLKGTPAWQDLEDAHSLMLAECRPYFDAAT